MTVSQQTFFCNNQHDEYNPTATDPDGDSLAFSLVPAASGPGTCASIGGPVTYVGALSATEPLIVLTDSFAINHATGALTFHPDAYQRAVVVYNIEEYRSGVRVGTSQREMTIIVTDCAITFPCMYTGTLHTKETSSRPEIAMYPNPANDQLTIKAAGGSYNSFTITNTVGQPLLTGQIMSAESVDVKFLPAGIYYITFRGAKGTQIRKFVKN